MRRQSETPGAGNVGGRYGRANASNRQSQYNMGASRTQEGNAPAGDLVAYLRGRLIMVGGRHLCSIHLHDLQRTFDSSRELLRGALCFRVDVLDLAQSAGVQTITATDRTTGKAWRVDLATFRRKGWEYNHPKFGQQIGLALSAWQVVGEDDKPELEQLSLFGGA